MKLRIKHNKRTTPITISEGEGCEPLTLQNVVELVKEELHFDRNDEVALSLNGKDPLGDPSDSLATHGIVSGDSLFVLLSSPSQKPIPDVSDHKESEISEMAPKKSEKKKEEKHTDFHPQPSTSGASSSHQGAGVLDVEEEDGDEEMEVVLDEPMLCSESSEIAVPQLLHVLYRDADVKNAHDAACVVIHILMMERGFQPLIGNDVVGRAMEMPHDWKSHSNYKLRYRHPACQGLTCSLACMTSGQLLMIHGIHKGPDSRHNCQLRIRPANYVKTLKPEASKTYNDLARLSVQFKENISLPLLQAMRQGLGLAPGTSLLAMASELQMKIFSYLDMESLVQVSACCKELRELAQNPYLWRRLYQIHFGSRGHSNLNQDWLKHFRERYIQGVRQRREWEEMQHVVPPPFAQHPYPGAPFAPIVFPGVIGGDYDLNPDFGGIPGPFNPLRAPGPRQPRLPRPRFDPWGPPDHRFRPGRGGGMWDGSGGGGMGGFM